MRTIVLHIGAMKTGTSYLQSILGANAELLEQRGVRWPGESWRHQKRATTDLLAARGRPESDLGAWEDLVRDIREHDLPRAVISMEFLSFAPKELAERAVASFAPDRVRVVLSLRDLGRVIPAQWQETTQNMHDWPYLDYLSDLMAGRPADTRCGRHFWNRQRWPRILRAWQPWVAPEDLVVVTVPPSGAPSNVLWDRFCEAAAIDGTGVDLKGFDNDSLGAVSAELMRRVSHEAAARGLDEREYQVLKSQLAKRVLVHRRRSEPTIVIPPERRAWVDDTSRRLIAEVRAVGPMVVGDLEDLIPRWPSTDSASATPDPGALDVQLLVDAAVDGLLGLSARLPRQGRGLTRGAGSGA